MSDLPKVTISPTEGGGVPLVAGRQTDMIAEEYLKAREAVLASLALSRAELITACWFEAKWGGRELFHERWRLWATYVEVELRRGELAINDLPLPPFGADGRRNEPGE